MPTPVMPPTTEVLRTPGKLKALFALVWSSRLWQLLRPSLVEGVGVPALPGEGLL